MIYELKCSINLILKRRSEFSVLSSIGNLLKIQWNLKPKTHYYVLKLISIPVNYHTGTSYRGQFASGLVVQSAMAGYPLTLGQLDIFNSVCLIFRIGCIICHGRICTGTWNIRFCQLCLSFNWNVIMFRGCKFFQPSKKAICLS